MRYIVLGLTVLLRLLPNGNCSAMANTTDDNADSSLITPEGVKLSIGPAIGIGGLATVFEVADESTGDKFALKKVRMNIYLSTFARNEVKIRKTISHENIVGLKSSWEDKTHIYILSELLTGGDLMQRMVSSGGTITPLPEMVAKKFIYQTALAIQYLHWNSIIHRDIKPENIFIDAVTGDAKLGDLGCAVAKSNQSLLRSKCGTESFMAPETLNGYTQSFEIDIWSLGVTSYFLLFGTLPFERTQRGTYRVEFPRNDFVSAEAKNLILRMIVVNPGERLSLENILAHEWFDDTGVTTEE